MNRIIDVLSVTGNNKIYISVEIEPRSDVN